MREYLVRNKSKIIKVIILLVVLFFVVSYLNGKNIYENQIKMMHSEAPENSRA